MQKRWLWLVLGILSGVFGWAIWQLVRLRQQEYDTVATNFMPPIPADEFVPRDEPEPLIPLLPAEHAPPAPDTPLISAPEAMPEPEQINVDAEGAPEPPPNVAADDQPATGDDRTADATSEHDEHDEHDEHEGELDGITGYCVRCRTKREIQEPQIEITENGRRAARGTCPVCGTTIFRFLKDAPAE